ARQSVRPPVYDKIEPARRNLKSTKTSFQNPRLSALPLDQPCARSDCLTVRFQRPPSIRQTARMASTDDLDKVREHLSEATGSTIHLIDGCLVTYEMPDTLRRRALENMDIAALLGEDWTRTKGLNFFVFRKTETVLTDYMSLILAQIWYSQIRH
ncbi:hypothetical protein ACCS93_39400, partial [Rhizobium ruizarguesonis]